MQMLNNAGTQPIMIISVLVLIVIIINIIISIFRDWAVLNQNQRGSECGGGGKTRTQEGGKTTIYNDNDNTNSTDNQWL